MVSAGRANRKTNVCSSLTAFDVRVAEVTRRAARLAPARAWVAEVGDDALEIGQAGVPLVGYTEVVAVAGGPHAAGAVGTAALELAAQAGGLVAGAPLTAFKVVGAARSAAPIHTLTPKARRAAGVVDAGGNSGDPSAAWLQNTRRARVVERARGAPAARGPDLRRRILSPASTSRDKEHHDEPQDPHRSILNGRLSA